MKAAFATLIALAIIGTAFSSTKTVVMGQQDNKFNFCLTEYISDDCDQLPKDSVCGLTYRGHFKTMHNTCAACSDSDVMMYLPGNCETNHVEHCDEIFRGSDICYELYMPVCGFDADGKYERYVNNCFACINSNVQYTVDGNCPGQTEEEDF